MAMRCCEQAARLNPNLATAVSLWISAFFRLEAEGYQQPGYFGENHADAGTYALTAGPEYLHRVLARALKNRNRPVALAVILALKRNSGQKSLLYQLGTEQPLITSLTYPDREVRFSAALTIGGVLPAKSFKYSERVMPILTEALQQKGQKYAVVIDTNQDRRNRITAQLRQTGTFAQVVSDGRFGVALEQSRKLPSFDLVVLAQDMDRPGITEALATMKKDYRLAFCPTIVLRGTGSLSQAKKLKDNHSFVEVLPEGATAADMVSAGGQILSRNQARQFDPSLADAYAITAADVLRQLAVTRNVVLDLKVAQEALIDATRDERPEILLASTQTLARIDSMAAQRAIVVLALDKQLELETRLMAFENLAISAKAHGNLLLAEQVEGIYNIVDSLDVDNNLRYLAAEAYGALNLPSATISNLIINQMQ
jgi:CheY-like chemotaxis protein